MSKTEWIEKNRDDLERKYYDLYCQCVEENEDTLWDILRPYENTLVQMGILEAEEDDEEDDDDDFDFWEDISLEGDDA